MCSLTQCMVHAFSSYYSLFRHFQVRETEGRTLSIVLYAEEKTRGEPMVGVGDWLEGRYAIERVLLVVFRLR